MESEKIISQERDVRLYSGSCAIKAWQLKPFEAAAFNRSCNQSNDELHSYCKYIKTTQHSNTLFIIPQQHSRSALKITSAGAEILSEALKTCSGFQKILSTFTRDDSDYYVGRAATYFNSTGDIELGDHRFEFCCLLPFVEQNSPKPANYNKDTCQDDVQRWSVRQQAAYHSYETSSPARQATVLINPSDQLWSSIKCRYTHPTGKSDTGFEEGWGVIPTVIFESLVANWADYISCLHRAVEQIKRDASFTHHDRRDVGEADTQSLRNGSELMDRLQTVLHVLGNIIVTVSAVNSEVQRRETLWQPAAERAMFAKAVGAVIRDIEFEQNQVRLIITRLETVLEMVRNLIQLRSDHTMEHMTVRTVLEARTMRLIALLSLCFLPPTFIAGLLDMNYINVKSDSGHLLVDVEPGLLFYVIVTVPVMLLVLGGFMWWDWRSTRLAKLSVASKV